MKFDIRINADTHPEIARLWNDLRGLGVGRESSAFYNRTDRQELPRRYLLLGDSEAVLTRIAEVSADFLGMKERVVGLTDLLPGSELSPSNRLELVFSKLKEDAGKVVCFHQVEHLVAVPTDTGNVNLLPLFCELLAKAEPATAILLTTTVPGVLPRKLAEKCDGIYEMDLSIEDHHLEQLLYGEISDPFQRKELAKQLREAVPEASWEEIVRGLQAHTAKMNWDTLAANNFSLDHVGQIAESIRQQKKLLEKFDQSSSEFLTPPNR